MAPYKKDGKKVHVLSFTVDGHRYYVKGRNLEKLKIKRKERKAEIEAALKAGMQVDADKMTVDQYIRDIWLPGKAPIKRKKTDPDPDSVGSYKELRGRIALHISPVLGRHKIKTVSPSELEQVLRRMLEYNPDRRDGNGRPHPDGYSYSAVKKIHDDLKQIFRRACADGYCIKDPSLDLRMPDDVEDTSRRALTDKELYTVLTVADDMRPSDQLFVLLVLMCGLRPQEVVALQWKRVHLDARYIEVVKALKKTKSVGSPKSAAGVRDVPIPEYLACRLEVHAGRPDDYVCTTTRGKPMKATAVQSLWDRVRTEMEYYAGNVLYKHKGCRRWVYAFPLVPSDLTAYTLRHTYATYLQAADSIPPAGGVPYDVRVRLMGHKDRNITGRYTHDNKEAFEAARAKIDSFWEKKLQNWVIEPESVAPCVAP